MKTHCCAGSCLIAGNCTQPADFRDIQDINTCQAAFETFTLLDKRASGKLKGRRNCLRMMRNERRKMKVM